MHKFILSALLMLCTWATPGFGQAAETYTQTLRGTVVDKETQQPIIGAVVRVLNIQPILGSVTDSLGRFSIAKVPIGRQDLQVRYLGYADLNIPNIQINSGKQTVLTLEMTENVQNKEVVIQGTRKDKPNNEMAVVSARQFTMEETQRFAGSLGDPARMAANFAGVSGANDSRNDIIIRGNSPAGLLWRLEGVDIPSPNHFSAQGTTGGPVSILNNNVLRNSDFFTGAFPAEYGNGTSGVFDLKLRNGNNQKYEFTGQIGFNGFEIMTEGPLSKLNGSSFLFSYRYSVLGFFQAVGINLGPAGVPKYQDLSFKVYVPTKKSGTFEFFGIGGISTIAIQDSKRKEENFSYGQAASDIYNGSDMGMIGASHTLPLGKKGYFRNILSVSADRKHTHVDQITKDPDRVRADSLWAFYSDTSRYYKTALHSIFNWKFNARNTLKTGIILSRLDFTTTQKLNDTSFGAWRTLSENEGNTYLGQYYAQWKHSFNDKLSLLLGGQAEYFVLNKTYNLEPRGGMKYNLTPKSSLSFGYGLHGQLQPLPVYFTKTLIDTARMGYVQTNRNLGFTRAQHLVLGYDWNFARDMRLKTEAYYQQIYNAPVTQNSSSFSVLNNGADFALPLPDSLVNKGQGRNYGVEITVEKFFSRNYFFLYTLSLFDSRYKASDGVWRNTVFNGHYSTNLLVGKDWKLNARNTITLSWRLTVAGGRRYTPINLEASQKVGAARYYNERAFEGQFSDYVKTDIRIGYKMNLKKITQEWALDIANLTNHKNVLTYSYDARKGKVVTEYQLGIFPMILYRIQF